MPSSIASLSSKQIAYRAVKSIMEVSNQPRDVPRSRRSFFLERCEPYLHKVADCSSRMLDRTTDSSFRPKILEAYHGYFYVFSNTCRGFRDD